MPCHPPPRSWGRAGVGDRAHLAVALPGSVTALSGAATGVTLALPVGDTRLCWQGDTDSG